MSEGSVARAGPPPVATEGSAAPPALVSVVVGVYNHARFVEECLDSIAGGSYPNLEIVIVDDASRDRSDEAVRGWIARHPDVPVRHIRHERNLGFTRSLNEAIEVMRGEYFSLIAADDVMLRDGISARVAYLERRSEKLAVFGDCEVIDAEGNPVHRDGLERGGLDNDFARKAGQSKRLLQIDELMPSNIVFHWAVPGPVFLCRAETFDLVGGYDEELAIEDWDMYLRVAATGRLGFLDQRVAKYREHDTNSGAAMGSRKRVEAAKVARKNLRRFDPINALRLAAIYVDCHREDVASRAGRFGYAAASRVLLFASYRAYRWKRARVLRRHGEGAR